MALKRSKKGFGLEHDVIHQFRTFSSSEDFEAWQKDRGKDIVIYSMEPVVVCTIGYRDAGDDKLRELTHGQEGGLPRGNVHGLFVIFFEEAPADV